MILSVSNSLITESILVEFKSKDDAYNVLIKLNFLSGSLLYLIILKKFVHDNL